MLITQAEWARRHGFSRQYVSKLVARGAVRLVDGKIDPVEADAALAALRQPAKPLWRSGQSAPAASPPTAQRIAGRGERPVTGKPLPDGTMADLPTLLLKTRIKSEAERGKLLELKAKVEAGKYIDADEVRAAAFNVGRRTRDRLFNIPDRLSAMLAAESDVRKVHETLTAEMRIACEELTGGPVGE